MKHKLRKGLAVGVICLLMLVAIPTTTSNEIEYPKENGPYIVFIGGKCYGGIIPGPINFEWLLILEEGYTRVIQFGPFHLYWQYPYGPDYLMEEGSIFIVNGQIQDVEYPVDIELMGFRGYAPAVFQWFFKMLIGRIRVIGVCDAINLDY
ncbi:MAG: hypothetical protein JSW60_08265 [Thermoplasmatales archaeon]|nr:MAG: hypothetical protein JSW60_08265 [Thermoplasmatales archaeon]